MCTAATYLTKDFYFGRTLDYEFSYGEEIAVTPRNYPFHFRHTENLEKHYAIIGMAHMAGDYPLYYDAVNEKGVGMAGLNFVGNAYYHKEESGKKNVASFEFIPWVLAQCATLDEVRELIADLNIVDTPFSENLPSGMLHWIISDKSGSITVESMKDGLHTTGRADMICLVSACMVSPQAAGIEARGCDRYHCLLVRGEGGDDSVQGSLCIGRILHGLCLLEQRLLVLEQADKALQVQQRLCFCREYMPLQKLCQCSQRFTPKQNSRFLSF